MDTSRSFIHASMLLVLCLGGCVPNQSASGRASANLPATRNTTPATAFNSHSTPASAAPEAYAAAPQPRAGQATNPIENIFDTAVNELISKK